jgi:hypothetical protein
MLVQSALAAPVLWLGGSPVLAYNLVLLTGFVLSGWTMTLVLAQWTGSWLAALTGGLAFAFNAHVFTRLPHLQALHVEFLPLALFALDRVLTRAALMDAVWLGIWFSLQALTSVYLLVFSATALVAATLSRPKAWWGKRFQLVAPRLALAIVVAALALAPFVLPYVKVSGDTGVERTLEDATGFAALWTDYLATPSRFDYRWWSYQFFGDIALFPGIVGIGLALVAVARGVAFKDPRARMCLVAGIVGVYLSFGTKAPGYAILYGVDPLLHAVRAVSRFGYLAIVAVAVLAAFGIAELQRGSRNRGFQLGLLVLPFLVAAEASPAPIWYARFEGVSPIYERLRNRPDAGLVLELPFFRSSANFRQSQYMLNSTRHWRPLVNGYSGFQPLSFYEHADALAGFPDAASLDLLRQLDVTHVFVHTEEFSPETLARIAREPSLRRIDSEANIALYRVVSAR